MSVWFLSGGLLAIGLAALSGGTFHGFQTMMPAWAVTMTWKTTMVAVGLASFGFAGASVFSAFSKSWRKPLFTVLLIKLAGYLLWLAKDDDFRFAIYEYSPTMVAVLGVFLYTWKKRRDPAAPWIVAGIVVSFLAALGQLGKVGFHEHFNHNDVYHVVQMVGVYLFYRGGRVLSDYRVDRA